MFNCFFPDEYLDSTYVINFDDLYAQGYRGLLFDILWYLMVHRQMREHVRCLHILRNLDLNAVFCQTTSTREFLLLMMR